MTDRSSGHGLLIVYGVASLAAVALGCLICAQSGVPTTSWARNVAAWIAGAVAAVALARWAGPVALRIAVIAAPLGLAVSLISPDQDGVRRWVDLGPAHVTIVFVLLPAAVVGLAARADRRWAWAAGFTALALLVIQPDASQATALGLAMTFIIWRGAAALPLKLAAIGLAFALVAAAWLRPDPLAPVAEVEEIIGLAWRLSPALAALAVVALATAVLSPALIARDRSGVVAPACALALYLAVTALAPLLGAFPVPLVGIGMSPVLGFWLGVGLLAAVWRVSRSNTAASPGSGS